MQLALFPVVALLAALSQSGPIAPATTRAAAPQVTYLGLVAAQMSKEDAHNARLPDGATVHVNGVIPDGPADRAGICAGDRIIAVDDKPIDTPEHLLAIVRAHLPGDQIVVTLNRRRFEFKRTVTLGQAVPKDRVTVNETKNTPGELPPASQPSGNE